MNKLIPIALLLPFAAGFQAAAQSWDTSGNNLLSGTYYFRQVVWSVQDSEGDVGEAISLYGNITFDGNGNYTISNVQVMDSNANSPCTIPQGNCSSYPTTGTYSIAANGYGWLDSLVTQDEVYGLVSNGIFVASTTENSACASNNVCSNDLFIAVPAPSTPFTNSSFQGTYTMASLDVTAPGVQNGVVYTRGSTFQMSPNGSGNVPSFTASGYITGNGNAQTKQSVPSASYTVNNSAVVYNLPGGISSGNAGTVLIAGQKVFYLSPDGNFVVGGSPTGFDMIVGVRGGNGSAVPAGLYYQAGVLVNNFYLSSDSAVDLQTYYGSYNIFDTSGDVVVHERDDDAGYGQGYYTQDFTYQDVLSLSSGVYTDSTNQYVFANNGAIAIGFPTILYQGGLLGITVLLQAPSLSGPGVYVNPNSIQNAGSMMPFTAQLAPGEMITLSGTNLADGNASDPTLPTTLGNVQVLINGEAASLSSVSPNQVTAVVPIDISPGSIASIQVMNDIGQSNIVTNFVGATQPGVFNSTAQAMIQHPNSSMVTESSPALRNETITLFLTGLGQLSGTSPRETFYVGFFSLNDGNETQATISSVSAQSSAGGQYQMALVVPNSLTSGDYIIDIYGPDSENFQALVPVGSGAATATQFRRNVRQSTTRARHAIRSGTKAAPEFRRNPKRVPLF